MKVLSVSYAKKQADLLYDPKQATPAQMAQALTRYRYVAYPLGEALKRTIIHVEGFGGFDKVPPLEEAIRKIPGVKGVMTDIIQRKITITFDGAKANQKILVATVAKMGLQVKNR